uniref:uncharacterized protein LOC100180990 isoform X2 n=1 Tax=Ciona intestinalis TaxID=7719 RepID=UPI000180BBD3|nr:uncharacterized protein LOC100180990 isoform X2 [Ciona intestinalis]|eukprot:XP_002120412.1 uncharacterized protein LOC100180990 isoform X2 [Ciona intestinalis]
MCSCAVAIPGIPRSTQYIRQPMVDENRNYRTGNTASGDAMHDEDGGNVVEVQPVLPWRNSRHSDVSMRVMLKTHDSQFKLPAGELQTHLHAIFHHLRPQDSIKLAVRLESWVEEHRRYLVIVTTTGRQDTEENIIVGCDFATKESTSCTIGLVLPIWCDTSIQLDGDGGFKVLSHEKTHTFKPVSVQAMWSALQSLHRCKDTALRHNYYEGSLYLTWTCFYASRVASNRININEWEYSEDLWSRKPNYFEMKDINRLTVESLIRSRLKQVMMTMDLDNCTCKQIRLELEKVIDMDLTNYKRYIDTEMLTVLGQMDCSSKILDYLYLGSEWNASNLEELTQIGITHILNVTLEVDNFFPDEFTYKNIRLHDIESSNLLQHWHATWRFIDEARRSGGKCLVHCKMGISRSSATVAAYLMKERLWTKKRALEFTEECRSITHPNPSFLEQLDEYEGMVFASANRHNKLFRSRSESSLSEPSLPDDHPVTSPRPPPAVQLPDDVNVACEDNQDFDLNRRLLDIASLSVPKVSRPKSWSPDEGRTCYNPSHAQHDNLLDRTTNMGGGDSIYPQNTSEPGEILIAPSGDQDRKAKANQRREDFKRAHSRRHTEATATARGPTMQLDDLAQSEDSVFVHDGNGPFVPAKAWPRPTTPPPSRGQVRTSSPAAISLDRTPVSLQVEEQELHSSMVSPRNSPSYKKTSTVDIDLLKSRFSDPSPSDPIDPPPPQPSDIPPPAIKAPVPVRQIVAVIESPIEDSQEIASKIAAKVQIPPEVEPFIKGHHKSPSLPPSELTDPPQPTPSTDAPMSRARSFSENQATSVKKLVTQIESRYSPDVSLPEDEGCTILRTMSMPSSKRRSISPIPSSFVALDEDAAEQGEAPQPDTGSSFYIGEQEPKQAWGENNNNNNNNNSFVGMIVINDISDQLLADVTKSNLDDVIVPSPHKKVTKPDIRGCFPPEVLDNIRQVDLDSLRSHVDTKPPTHAKQRGLVSQMVRKLTGKAPKSKSSRPASLNMTKKKNSNNISNKMNRLLMGGSDFQATGERLARHSYEPNKHSTDVFDRVGSDTSPVFSPCRIYHDPRHQHSAQCIDISIYAATPYRPHSGSPPTRMSLGIKDRRVRRSQSERVGIATRRRSTHYTMISETGKLHHATRSYKSQPELTDPPTRSSPPLRSPLPVREIVRTLEAKKTTSVHRSSSLPPTKPRQRMIFSTSSNEVSKLGSLKKNLPRSKSTPFLGFNSKKTLKQFKYL